jgi:hypothetical protein
MPEPGLLLPPHRSTTSTTPTDNASTRLAATGSSSSSDRIIVIHHGARLAWPPGCDAPRGNVEAWSARLHRTSCGKTSRGRLPMPRWLVVRGSWPPRAGFWQLPFGPPDQRSRTVLARSDHVLDRVAISILLIWCRWCASEANANGRSRASEHQELAAHCHDYSLDHGVVISPVVTTLPIRAWRCRTAPSAGHRLGKGLPLMSHGHLHASADSLGMRGTQARPDARTPRPLPMSNPTPAAGVHRVVPAVPSRPLTVPRPLPVCRRPSHAMATTASDDRGPEAAASCRPRTAVRTARGSWEQHSVPASRTRSFYSNSAASPRLPNLD